jgi:hypothetical protein
MWHVMAVATWTDRRREARLHELVAVTKQKT